MTNLDISFFHTTSVSLVFIFPARMSNTSYNFGGYQEKAEATEDSRFPPLFNRNFSGPMSDSLMAPQPNFFDSSRQFQQQEMVRVSILLTVDSH